MLASIIITNYNYGNYLHRCIRSCLNQSLPADQFEIIVVDDSSNDNSDNIIEEYKSLPNFTYIKNKKNFGVAKSSNNAIRKSKGKFIVRVDSDDYVTREFTNILSYYLLENPEYLGAACDYYLVDDNEKILEKRNCLEHPIGCAIIFRADQLIDIGMYDKDFLINEEVELRKRFEKKYSVERVPLPLYRYRQHVSNMTKKK